MSIFDRYYKPKKRGVKRNESKHGPALFFDVLGREFQNLVKLNMIFVLFCIPVITIPAAITAASKNLFLMLRDKPQELFYDFFQCFKKEFFRSLLVGFGLAMLIGISAFSFDFYSFEISDPVFSMVLRTVLLIIVGVCFIAGFFAFPLLAVTDLPVKSVFKNAFLLVVVLLPYNLIALVLLFTLWVTMLFVYPYSLPFVFLILISLSGLITTTCAQYGIDKYIIK